MLQIADRMTTLGTETAFEVLARANALAAQGKSIINLGIGQPDFPTPDHIVEAGRKAYFRAGCNGCHGGNGGGGMCPPLTNDTWVYGGDDDTLFRLVTLGSDDLQKAGYTRTGHENVVGPMPPMGPIIKSSDDLWKIITFIRSNYHGDPSYKFGAPANP